MDKQQLEAEIVGGLGLDSPVIGLTFVDEAPVGVTVSESPAPSACSMWRQAETDVFYAPAERHFNCAVGAMTMGFELPGEVQQRLGQVVEMMCSCGYLASDEPASIPTIKQQSAGIVYGPLGKLPVEPDLAVMWLDPRQAMLFAEAAGGANWANGQTMAFTGRPACAALPLALEGGPRLSLGCAGMRTFTDVSQDRMLAVVPGANLAEFTAALNSTVHANQSMQGAYDQMKAEFTGAPAAP
jgi:uncharacterized protein (DUF169 family)